MAAIRWGIAGPGRIAHKFAKSLPWSTGKLLASASSSLERARAFSSEYNLPFAFGSYREMLQSGEIDALYVATTNQLHAEVSAMALDLGIPVLCEKPLTISTTQTRELVDFAKQKKVFLMEGLWSLFLPHIRQTVRWIREGEIGKLVHIQADFGFTAPDNPDSRILNPALGGGVGKDIGIYPMALFFHLLGPLGRFQTTGSRAATGVDNHNLFQGLADSGASFQGMVSFKIQSPVEATILGEKGKIRLGGQWLRPTSATLENESGSTTFHPEVPSFGFQFEADEVANCLIQKRTESNIWSLSDSLQVASYLEEISSF